MAGERHLACSALEPRLGSIEGGPGALIGRVPLVPGANLGGGIISTGYVTD